MISKATFTKILVAITSLSMTFAQLRSISNSTSKVVKERIITDFKDVINGVPIDYRYNESDNRPDFIFPGEHVSVPGCPKSDEGYPWIYFGTPAKCYLAGQRGPCEADHILFVKIGTPFGFCNCDCFEGAQTMGKETKDQDRFCTALFQEFVFMPALEKCFTLYDQGPCLENEWVIKIAQNVNGTNAFAKCEARKCPMGQVPIGEDKDGKTSCSGRFSVYASPFAIPKNQCESEGMKYSKLLKKCVKRFSIEF